jgi:hypothetical protein
MLFVGFSAISLGLLVIFIFSSLGIVSWEVARSPRYVELRFRHGVAELRLEPVTFNTTEYVLARTRGTSRWRVPGIASGYNYDITFLSPTYMDDLKQGYSYLVIPPYVLAKYGPPPPNAPAKSIRLHLWPFMLLTGFYPFLIFARFVRPAPTRRRRRYAATLLSATLFTVVSGVSLLIFAATAVFWIRSGYFRSSEQSLSTSFRPTADETATIGTTWFFTSHRWSIGMGRVVSNHIAGDMKQIQAEHVATYTALYRRFGGVMAADPTGSFVRQLGFGFASGNTAPSGVGAASQAQATHWWISFPCWLLLVISALLPVSWGRWYRRTGRTRWRFWRGQCLQCGYSVTGNKSGVCPECGTSITL